MQAETHMIFPLFAQYFWMLNHDKGISYLTSVPPFVNLVTNHDTSNPAVKSYYVANQSFDQAESHQVQSQTVQQQNQHSSPQYNGRGRGRG